MSLSFKSGLYYINIKKLNNTLYNFGNIKKNVLSLHNINIRCPKVKVHSVCCSLHDYAIEFTTEHHVISLQVMVRLHTADKFCESSNVPHSTVSIESLSLCGALELLHFSLSKGFRGRSTSLASEACCYFLKSLPLCFRYS